MEKFIYVFNEKDYLKLINLGFTFICKCNLGKECYVFNNDKRILTFVTGDVEVIAVAEDQHTGRDWDPKKYPRK